jgi:sigma-B regulation protein RsbU (phosphoserine phosphatase)
VLFAGAHEEIVVLRAATQKAETVPTPGTWLGARRDVSEVTTDEELGLGVGDVMVLYTDGVTEAFNEAGEMFELERLIAILEEHASSSCAEIHERIWSAVEAWTHQQDDDVTLMVIRRVA